MWRTVLAVVAIGLNVVVLLSVALSGIGLVAILARHQGVSTALIVGMTMFGVAGLAAVVSIVAISVRMGRSRDASSAVVASQFN